ncbi:hypothetical protein [Actinoplanes sp. NPDC049802]|uniref:hypothetical protein n=1 Tax=Actinoplanes sp. NPDC049802 TaxID=3154742 RepID=UPI0033E93EC8
MTCVPGAAVVVSWTPGFGVAVVCAPGSFRTPPAGPLVEPVPDCPVVPPLKRLPPGVVAVPAIESGAASFGPSSFWPAPSGPRLDAGGPGFGRLRPGVGRRDSARLRLGALMCASHAGRPP